MNAAASLETLKGEPMFILVAAWWVLSVIAAIWVGRDAVRRAVPAPWAWCLGAALGSLPVWIVYLVVRDDMVSARDR